MMPSIELKYTFESEEELRAHLGGETRTVATPTPTPTPPATTQGASEVDATDGDEQRNDAEVDSENMPYNPAVHTETRAVNADGTWKARRGKADEAKQAREAFKAGGGAEEAPAELPGANATPSLPGVDALPADAPKPVSFEEMSAKAAAALNSGAISQPDLMKLYAKHGGENPVATLQTNETARAALVADLEA